MRLVRRQLAASAMGVLLVTMGSCDLAKDTADTAKGGGEGAVGIADKMSGGTVGETDMDSGETAATAGDSGETSAEGGE